MAEYLAPPIHVEETSFRPPSIVGVPTGTAALLGTAGRGPTRPRLVTSFAEYERVFGSRGRFLPHAVRGFFANGGRRAFVGRIKGTGGLARSLAALERETCREVALVAAPGLVDPADQAAIVAHCEVNRRFALLDRPRAEPARGGSDPSGMVRSRDAAAYAPWLAVAGAEAKRRIVPPSGHVLGVYARKDSERGVWSAPAGELVKGVQAPDRAVDDAVQDAMAARGLNAIRGFPGRGILVWGARTLSADAEWKYVSVRRLFLFLERSIDQGTQWVVFEPNGVPLWKAVRHQIELFLTDLWRAGASPAARPDHAFYVRCDETVMAQADIDSGRLVIEIGFAPLRPAEYIVLRIGQWTCEACS